MVIDDLHFICSSLTPAKADTELVVDPNAVLPLPICLQRFQPVARGKPKIAQDHR
jgi:hypothetical protein